MSDQPDVENMSPEEIAELQKKNCVFCKIIKGEIPSHKVYEDDMMISILDIYPASKGHLLVMPKEHQPIMPLLPPQVFNHLFSKVKFLSRAVREGVPSEKTTIFIANGGIAGQQSPHFLFHVIPRDAGDGLDNFNIPPVKEDQKKFQLQIKSNLGQMMANHLRRLGKPSSPSGNAPPGTTPNKPSKQQLADMLEKNPQVKELIKQDPERFKKEISGNPTLQALFDGVDINKLSQKLKELEGGTQDTPNDNITESPQEKTSNEQDTSEDKPDEDSEPSPTRNSDDKPDSGDDDSSDNSETNNEEDQKKEMLDDISKMFT